MVSRDTAVQRVTGIEPAWPAWKAGDLVAAEAGLSPRAGRHRLPAGGRRPVPAIATATPYGKDAYQQWHNLWDAPEGNVPGSGFTSGTSRSPTPVRGTGPRLLGAQRLRRRPGRPGRAGSVRLQPREHARARIAVGG